MNVKRDGIKQKERWRLTARRNGGGPLSGVEVDRHERCMGGDCALSVQVCIPIGVERICITLDLRHAEKVFKRRAFEKDDVRRETAMTPAVTCDMLNKTI